MRNILTVCATLAVTLGALSVPAAAQTSSGAAPGSDKFDVAANITYKFAKIASTTHHFVLPGGSVDAAWNLPWNLSLVADINGETRSNVEPGVNLTQLSLLGGVRYTFHIAKNSPHALDLYGQFLGGKVFASNSLFPAPGAATTSASSGAIQTGGGANLRLSHSLAVRLVEVDFITTSLPNSTNNRQYDVRFSNGIVFRF